MKIDKSFILDRLKNSDSAAIVRAPVGPSHNLGLKVVAEGMENQAISDRPAALGCDTAQGYHIAHSCRRRSSRTGGTRIRRARRRASPVTASNIFVAYFK